MSIENKIEALKLELKKHLEDETYDVDFAFEAALKDINQDFQMLSDAGKMPYRASLEEIYALLNQFVKQEKEIQAGIKQQISAINKRSTATNAYQKTSNLGTYTR